MTNNSRSTHHLLGWCILGIGALFYCYAYFLRQFPTVMASEIINHFQINAALFGNLTAFYYYAYTPLQLPVGVILDRYGPRLVLSIASLICTAGIILFSLAKSIVTADIGRFLMGFGSAFAYVSGLKLAAVWLPKNRFATATGLVTSAGMLTGAVTLMLLSRVVEAIGTTTLLIYASIVGVVLSVIIFSCIRNQPKQVAKANQNTEKLTMKKLLKTVLIMVKNPQMWVIGLIGCLLYMPCSVFLDTWGMPYLQTVDHFKVGQAGSLLACISFGWVLSGPIIGALSDKWQRRRAPLIVCTSIAAVIIGVIFLVPGLSLSTLYLLFFALGSACGAHPLCFVLAKENYPAEMSATAASVTNTLIMIGGVVFQPLVGILIDKHWNGQLAHHVPLYSAADFRYGLSILPAALVVAAVMTLLVKDTLRQPAQKKLGD